MESIPSDVSGKIYAITGTSSGIGAVIACELSKRGAMVKASRAGVVVSTSSSASSTVSRQAPWDDLNAEEKYDPWEVNGVSKIAAFQFRDGLRAHLAKRASLQCQGVDHAPRPYRNPVVRCVARALRQRVQEHEGRFHDGPRTRCSVEPEGDP